jgi:GAF domain-containing protein
MPYLVCPVCETPTSVVTRGDCPQCAAQLRARAGPAAPNMPVGSPTLRASARGDRELAPGTAAPLRETLCKQLLDGRVGPVIADVAAEPVVGGLARVRESGIGACIGVPVPAGERLFVLCLMARDARPEIGPRELRVCEGLAATVTAVLDDQRR